MASAIILLHVSQIVTFNGSVLDRPALTLVGQLRHFCVYYPVCVQSKSHVFVTEGIQLCRRLSRRGKKSCSVINSQSQELVLLPWI